MHKDVFELLCWLFFRNGYFVILKFPLSTVVFVLFCFFYHNVKQQISVRVSINIQRDIRWVTHPLPTQKHMSAEQR